jgi:hypothetical protein
MRKTTKEIILYSECVGRDLNMGLLNTKQEWYPNEQEVRNCCGIVGRNNHLCH